MRYFPYNHLFEAPISRRYTLRRLIILSVLSVMFGTGFVHDASSQTSGTFALRRRKTIWFCVAVLKKMTNGICALP